MPLSAQEKRRLEVLEKNNETLHSIICDLIYEHVPRERTDPASAVVSEVINVHTLARYGMLRYLGEDSDRLKEYFPSGEAERMVSLYEGLKKSTGLSLSRETIDQRIEEINTNLSSPHVAKLSQEYWKQQYNRYDPNAYFLRSQNGLTGNGR